MKTCDNRSKVDVCKCKFYTNEYHCPTRLSHTVAGLKGDLIFLFLVQINGLCLIVNIVQGIVHIMITKNAAGP